ncbi:MAG: universal stress protein [Burkholderiales bacterium]|nr:universal stress protein [Burkholderiales bacterium]
MYKNILVPIDGSRLSDKAAKEAVGLAKAVGAKITLFHCVADFPAPVYAESAIMAAQVTAGQYRKEAVKHAEDLLAKAAQKLEGTGLKVDTVHAVSDLPYDAIIAAAGKKKCDLIIMASHGRRGLSGFLLGSETQKVLTHSKVPVLVVR